MKKLKKVLSDLWNDEEHFFKAVFLVYCALAVIASYSIMGPQKGKGSLDYQTPLETEIYIDPDPFFPEPVEAPEEDPDAENWVRDYSSEEAACMAANIYHEARGEGLDGMMGVGLVTINRVHDSRWGDDVCSVVKEPWQFSWVHEGKPKVPEPNNPIDQEAYAKILILVDFLLSGGYKYVDHLASDAVFFHNPGKVDWRYAYAYEELGDVGNHRFFA